MSEDLQKDEFLNKANDDLNEEKTQTKAAKAKPDGKKIGRLAGIICGAIVFILIIAFAIYCGVTHQSPVSAFNSATGKNDNKIVGIWESDANPGISAYQFNSDGTCDQYVLTAVFHWDYTVKGNKLTMTNDSTSKSNVYQITVNDKELTMKLIVQDDKKVESDEALLYNSVEELNQSTLVDAIQNLKGDSEETTTE